MKLFRIGRSDRKSKQNRPGDLSRSRKFFMAAGIAMLVIVAVLSITAAVIVRQAASTLPSPEEMAHFDPDLSTIVYDRNEKIITRLFHENRTWVTLPDISKVMQQAAIAAEDSSFYRHGGLDFAAILRAVWVDISHREVKQGASTITQQLARNLFLSREQTLGRKIKEAILALRLERIYTKDQILEMYLNMIYFGHGAWGIHSAAQLYFNKQPSELNLSEASVLAGLIKAPEYYTPLRHPERAAVRQKYVLGQMLKNGWITGVQEQEAQRIELDFHNLKKPAIMFDQAPYFISHILFEHLLPTYGSEMVYRGGLRVYTTIDIDVQKAAENAIQALKSEGAIVAIDPDTGEIQALVGGKDFEQTKFNRATQAFRQPGSSFKPFVYTAALETGIRGVDHILDGPVSYDNGYDEEGIRDIWEPQNYGKEFHGEVTIVEGLTRSYNTVAVRVGHITGIDKILGVARSAGFTSPHLPADLSLSLGSASVTPLEMASSYCVFANGGSRVRPYAIRKITSPAGEILEQWGPELTPSLPPDVVLSIRSLLFEVVRAGTGTRARIPDYQTFGKTGTTNEYSDAWFAGGVPGLVTVVYAGNDDHKSLGRPGTGGAVAAPVWKAFVSEAVEILSLPKQFVMPENSNTETVSVCRESGFLAGAGCPSAVITLPRGMPPTTICPLHGGSWAAAQADPEAPRLLLSPRDMEMLGIETAWAPLYSVSIDDMTIGIRPPGAILPESSEIELAPSPASVPAGKTEPYPGRERTPQEVEERYQELLREYGLEE